MFCWDAIPLRPRASGVDRDAAHLSQPFRARSGDDLCMSPHLSTMHFAQVDFKRLLHSGRRYALCMSTPNERLREARSRHFTSAAEAAHALGIPYGTYAGHENGNRGFPASRAPQYARKFKVSEEWLLYGKGEGEDDPVPSESDLEQMIRESLEDVVTLETRLSDLPRIVAPALHEQLERFRADRATQGTSGGTPSPDKSFRSPAATKRGAKEERHSA